MQDYFKPECGAQLEGRYRRNPSWLLWVHNQDRALLALPGWSRHSDGIVRTGPDRESVESLHARIEQLESDLADTHEESATNATAADNAETALEAARDEIWDVRNQLEELREELRGTRNG